MEKWKAMRAVRKTATAGEVTLLLCSYKTMSWMIDRGADIAVVIPGLVDEGRLIGEWGGKNIERAEHHGVLTVHRADQTVIHVRVEEGSVHDGEPSECYRRECLVEVVIGS